MAVPADVRRGMDCLVLLVCWFLWKERNHRVFDAISGLPNALLAALVEEGNNWIGAGNSNLATLLSFLAV